MNEDSKQGIIDELKSFHTELKSYKRLLDKEKQLSENQKRYKESLREKLERKSGAFKGIIIETTGKQYYGSRLTGTYDIWVEAFNTIAMSSDRTAITLCTSAVNEAIGKLDDYIGKGIRDEQGNLIGEPPKDTGELPVNLFDAMRLHPRVIQVSESLFKTGNYASAILEAFKAVHNYVQDKTGLTLDGVNLMEKVFNENKPILQLNELLTQSDKNEQKGFKYIFMGCQTGIRNPKAHEYIQMKDPNKTLEYLSIASLLMRRIDESKLVKLNI